MTYFSTRALYHQRTRRSGGRYIEDSTLGSWDSECHVLRRSNGTRVVTPCGCGVSSHVVDDVTRRNAMPAVFSTVERFFGPRIEERWVFLSRGRSSSFTFFRGVSSASSAKLGKNFYLDAIFCNPLRTVAHARTNERRRRHGSVSIIINCNNISCYYNNNNTVPIYSYIIIIQFPQ